VSGNLGEGRFLYYVRPVGTQWELVFGREGSRFLYDSQDEALEAARIAARLHWHSTSHPSGVAIDAPGMRRTVDYFGNWV
jgi:hypothetical protein